MLPTHSNEAFAYLSVLDKSLDNAVVHQGYVLSKHGEYDTTQLYNALIRVTEKWRMLAGRVEWDKRRNTYRIRIPLRKLRKPAFKLTTAKYDEFIHSPSFSQSCVATQPDIKYFWHPSTPTMLARYAFLDYPLLSIYFSTLNDATCVGICLPHGVFDAVGVGLVLRAIDAELAGRDWTPPPQPNYNAVDSAFVGLGESHLLLEGPIPNQWSRAFGAFVPSTILNLFKFLTLLCFEYLFQNTVARSVFLDEDATRGLVYGVKTQVKMQTDGRGWVSTGDILVAWFLKAAFSNANDANLNAITVLSDFSCRQLLQPRDPVFSAYPHNCALTFSLPEMTPSRVRFSTLGELALSHRECLEEGRTLGFIQQTAYYLETFQGKACIPNHRWKEPALNFTNQVIAGFTDIDFGQGTTIKAFWQWSPPIAPDNVFSINKFKDGYIITGLMRKYRWDAIGDEIKRINNGGLIL